MPQPAFLNKALVALKEWLPYQASWLIEFQPGSQHSSVKFTHGQSSSLSVPVAEVMGRLHQGGENSPLPMVITYASLLAHQHHKLQQQLSQLLTDPYLMFTDCSAQPGQLLLLMRTDEQQYFSDRDRIMAEWLLPHLCEASRLSPQRIISSDSVQDSIAAKPGLITGKTGPHPVKKNLTRSPLELHINAQNRVVFYGEYIRACINNCSEAQHDCHLDDKQQLTLSDKLIKQIRQQQEAGHIELDKLAFDITTAGELCIIRVRPDSIQHLLTSRERQIASKLAQGLSYKEVAKNLHLSPSTVTNYANRIYRKLNVHSKSQLAHLYAISEAELMTQ